MNSLADRQQHASYVRRLRGVRAWCDRQGGVGGLAVLFLRPRVLRDPLVQEYLELAHIHFDLYGPDSLMHSGLPS